MGARDVNDKSSLYYRWQVDSEGYSEAMREKRQKAQKNSKMNAENYLIVARPDDISAKLAENTRALLNEKGFTENPAEPRVVFVIGGDGTFLYAVDTVLNQMRLKPSEVSFYGIHTGTLGFYTDFVDGEFDAFMKAFLEDACQTVLYPLLRLETDTGLSLYAVNEIRVENAARCQTIDVMIGGASFETFHGSGLCVCSPAGSTAFNRSLGGALIQEGLSVMEITEIAGIRHGKYRSVGASLILKGDTVITLKSPSFEGALLCADAQTLPADDIKEITVSLCEDKALRMLKGRRSDWFAKLKILF